MIRNRYFFKDGRASHSSCTIMSARHGVADTGEFGQREGVAATKEFRQKESVAATKKNRKRGRMCFKTAYL